MLSSSEQPLMWKRSKQKSSNRPISFILSITSWKSWYKFSYSVFCIHLNRSICYLLFTWSFAWSSVIFDIYCVYIDMHVVTWIYLLFYSNNVGREKDKDLSLCFPAAASNSWSRMLRFSVEWFILQPSDLSSLSAGLSIACPIRMSLYIFLLYYSYHLCLTCIDFYDLSAWGGCWLSI